MFIYLVLLEIISCQTTIQLGGSTLNINNYHNASIANGSALDSCRQIEVNDFCLGHLNSEGTFQDWQVEDLSTSYDIFFLMGASYNVT